MEKMRWKIVADHVTVCHHCGVPCMGTFLIWYVDNGLRMAFETDTLSLEEPMGELVQQASDQGRYPALPSFVREWNETVGWCAANTNGTEVSLAELIETAAAVAVRSAISAIAALSESSNCWGFPAFKYWPRPL